ncbi:MAG TPA: potassium channel family protein [Ktedonobacterales bacterium]|nr:potassium channel family protein [Ktedonobacterales bacterium]
MLVLRVVTAIAAVLVIAVVLWDAFETVVLPRTVSRRFRLTRAYTRTTWRAWTAFVRRVPASERRETAAAIYGPMALLILLALWASLLIVAYALLLWGLGSPLTMTGTGSTAQAAGFGTDLYYSGTTFLTLGLGDVFPHAGPARAVAVIEVGTGFGMLALVIGYLPILYQAFSRREVRISLLDAHAGSPPTAGALILRHPPNRRAKRLTTILAEWEDWSAELLETHLSYPLLASYRSQHDDQSWVAALAMILDTCALVLACGSNAPTARDGDGDGDGDGSDERDELAEQAAVTFAIARHAAVDLAQVFRVARPRVAAADGRLSPDEHARLKDLLKTAGVGSSAGKHGEGSLVGEVERVEGQLNMLKELRALYEPYIEGLAEYLLMDLPPWVPTPGALDDWQTTAEGLTAPSIASLVSRQRAPAEQHAVPPADGSAVPRP